MQQSNDMRWLVRILTGILFMLTVIAVELSALIPTANRQVHAQGTAVELRRPELLELAQSQNKATATLDRILQHLKTEAIKVKVVGTDKDSDAKGKKDPLPGKR